MNILDAMKEFKKIRRSNWDKGKHVIVEDICKEYNFTGKDIVANDWEDYNVLPLEIYPGDSFVLIGKKSVINYGRHSLVQVCAYHFCLMKSNYVLNLFSPLNSYSNSYVSLKDFQNYVSSVFKCYIDETTFERGKPTSGKVV